MRAYKVTQKKRQAAKKPVLQQEPGLLAGSTRKQSNWEKEKTGMTIRQPERREGRIVSSITTTSGTFTLYTVPANKKAKVLYYLPYYYGNAGNQIDYKIDTNFITTIFPAAATNNSVPLIDQPYESAPIIKKDMTIVVLGAGPVRVSALVVEEEASDSAY